MIPYFPVVMLVFGFVFTIILQAWFVRRISRLSTAHQDRKETYDQLQKDLMKIAEEVADLRRATDSNTVSVTTLEREIEEAEKKKEEFLAEHGDRLEAMDQADRVTEDG